MFMETLYLFGSLISSFGLLLGYMNNNAFPKALSAAEEQEVLARYSAGDAAAKDILIERNLRLVAHLCKKFESTGIDKEDLISIGTIGLIKAINSFDTSKNIRFATYGARCIENEILMYLRASKNSRSDISLNDPIGTDKEGNEMSLLETMSDQNVDILEEVEQKDDERLLNQSLKKLSPKERYIIIKRYGLNNEDEHTQREIAKELGISRSYVSRIEKKAIEKLSINFK